MKRRLQLLALAVLPVAALLIFGEVAVRLTGAAEECSSWYSDSQIWTCDPILYFLPAGPAGI